MKRFCIVLAFFTSSCAFHGEIPEGWKLPVQVEGEICPNISGTYLNSGEATKKDSYAQLDFHWAVGKYNTGPTWKGMWADIGKVQIQQEENQLEISSMAESGTLMRRRVLRKESGDFSCQDGWIRIKEANSTATSSAGMVRQDSRLFGRTDGYLIEKNEWNFFALFLILPVISSGTDWYKFLQIENPIAKQQITLPRNEKIAVIGFRDCLIPDQSDCSGSGKIASDIFARVIGSESGRQVQLISRPVDARTEFSDREAVSFAAEMGFKYFLTGEVTQYYDCAPRAFRPDRAGVNLRVIQAPEGKVISTIKLELIKENIGSPDVLFERMAQILAEGL